MKHYTVTIVVAAFALSVASATAQSLVLDDFTLGSQDLLARATHTTCKTFNGVTPLGSSRTTALQVGLNPYGLISEINVGNGHLIEDAGLGVYDRLDLEYGLNCANGLPNPLALNLSVYGRFRINFLGIVGNSALNFNIVVFQHDGKIYSAGQNLVQQNGIFYVDFPFSTFVSNNSSLPPDFSNVDKVDFVFQTFDNFGIASITAVL